MQDIKPGDTVYLFARFNQMASVSKVERLTAKSIVVDGAFFDKESFKCIRSNRKAKGCGSIKLPTPTLDAEWSELSARIKKDRGVRDSRRKIAAYSDHMRIGNGSRLTEEQLAQLVQALEGILGPVGELGKRSTL